MHGVQCTFPDDQLARASRKTYFHGEGRDAFLNPQLGGLSVTSTVAWPDLHSDELACTVLAQAA